MRYATVLLPNSDQPLVVVAGIHGWIEVGEVTGSSGRLEEMLPALMADERKIARQIGAWKGRCHAGEQLSFLPPVTRPVSFRDFYAFEAHVRTARGKRGLDVPPAWYDLPVFYFSNPGALVGNGMPVFAPAGCDELDYELELGIIMGRGGRDIAPENAWSHIGGLTILNDFSARDLQRKEITVGLGPAKGKDFATAVGPWLVTLSEFAPKITGEKISLEMTASVNGTVFSRGNSDSLFHSIPRMVAYASRDVELYPGDLLGSGTVGTGCILERGPEATGGWLKPGDVVDLRIEGIGNLKTPIVARKNHA